MTDKEPKPLSESGFVDTDEEGEVTDVAMATLQKGTSEDDTDGSEA